MPRKIPRAGDSPRQDEPDGPPPIQPPGKSPAAFHVRYLPAGSHIHCALYVAPAPDLTFALCGVLTMRDHEFADLRALLEPAPNVEFSTFLHNAETAEVEKP